jgi:hypothetical protein
VERAIQLHPLRSTNDGKNASDVAQAMRSIHAAHEWWKNLPPSASYSRRLRETDARLRAKLLTAPSCATNGGNMNPDHPESEPASQPHPEPAPLTWRDWARRLLVCNPFFLCSAALLLYGVNRLSGEDQLFRDEIHNLLFNFSALQFYEVLVVIAALVLARRRVWYDSALLAVLEQGLVLVPFMLISQATVQGETARDGLSLAWSLALAGGAVAVVRYSALRRWYPQFNLPPRALLLGALILAGNVALPLVFRPRMERDLEDWADENLVLWYVILPLLCAGANLIRRPTRYGGLNPERHWLPLFIYGLWTAGSAVHVWSVAHICGFPLESHHLAPLACVIAWTLWNRLPDFLPHPSLNWQRAVLALAFIVPFLAFKESYLFTMLAGATCLAYVSLWLRTSDTWPLRSMAKHLVFGSLAAVIAGMPEDWGQVVLPAFTRPRCIALACSFFVLLHAMRSRQPGVGLAGALALAAGLALEGPRIPGGFHFIVQAASVFILLHSLRWADMERPGQRALCWFAGSIWAVDACIWTRDLRWEGILITGLAAAVVLAAWLLAWRFVGQRSSLALPAASAVVLGSGPGNWLVRHGSDGVLALLGSLALFAVGVVVAWTRHRWESKDKVGQG